MIGYHRFLLKCWPTLSGKGWCRDDFVQVMPNLPTQVLHKEHVYRERRVEMARQHLHCKHKAQNIYAKRKNCLHIF